jgi:hypothetical protein
MRIPTLSLVIFLCFAASAYPQQSQSPPTTEHPTTFGTLIGAYGNANGIVVVTDSMLTVVTPEGITYPKIDPGQKLLELDDRTVCAIAGINQLGVQADPDLDADILGLIQDYKSQLREKESLMRTLQGLSGMLQFYLSEIATIQVATKRPMPLGTYKLDLLLVGYDIDGLPKIGSLVIAVEQGIGRSGHTEILPKVTEFSLTTVEKEFVYKTHGLDDIAQKILGNPDKYEGYLILEKYSDARAAADCGASLSLPDIEELGRTVLTITSMTYKRQVGLNKQVAVFKDGLVVSLDQPRFLDLKKPLPLTVFQDVNFGSGRIVTMGNAVKFYDSAWFTGTPRQIPDPRDFVPLDSAIFVNCHFKNKLLYYNGGPLYFDDTNVFDNVEIVFGAEAQERPELVQMLHDKSLSSLKRTSP